MNVFIGKQGVSAQAVSIGILPFHIYAGDATVAVGGVVIDLPGSIATGGVEGVLQTAVSQSAAAFYLFYRGKNVKELSDFFRFTAVRMHFCKCCPNEPGLAA